MQLVATGEGQRHPAQAQRCVEGLLQRLRQRLGVALQRRGRGAEQAPTADPEPAARGLVGFDDRACRIQPQQRGDQLVERVGRGIEGHCTNLVQIRPSGIRTC